MIKHSLLRKVSYGLILLGVTIGIGVLGFHFIEGYEWLDSLYMTAITVSTVGFEVLGAEGLSDAGKIFVIFLIVFSIGTFLYVINTLTTLVVEGEIRSALKGYRVNKEISKLSDHIVICGLGRNGRQAAIELLSEGKPFVVIEMNEQVIEEFLDDHPGALFLKGDATHEDMLEAAHVHSASGVITALADDASNVYVTLAVREINPSAMVVARASNERTISKLRVAGASRVILPNILGGRKMARIITKPALVDFIDLITGQGNFQMNLEQIDCMKTSSLVGKTLRELDIRSKTGVMVLGIQASDGHFELNPDANKPVEINEKLFIIGTGAQVNEFKRLFN